MPDSIPYATRAELIRIEEKLDKVHESVVADRLVNSSIPLKMDFLSSQVEDIKELLKFLNRAILSFLMAGILLGAVYFIAGQQGWIK
jgi:hypothetical protein